MESYQLPLKPDGFYVIADVFRLYSAGGTVKLKPKARKSLRVKEHSILAERESQASDGA
jgi:hypothetical protein